MALPRKRSIKAIKKLREENMTIEEIVKSIIAYVLLACVLVGIFYGGLYALRFAYRFITG
jgi:hypothetical protein